MADPDLEAAGFIKHNFPAFFRFSIIVLIITAKSRLTHPALFASLSLSLKNGMEVEPLDYGSSARDFLKVKGLPL